MSELKIELSGSKDFGPCECCGGDSRTVWGFVHSTSGPEAAYFVQWTMGHVDQHGANVDLIVGKWGIGAKRADRCAIALEFRRTEQGPSFMVIDSASRPVATSDLVGRSLARSEVIGSPLAKIAFDIVDAIWLQDGRIAEIVGAE